MNHIDVKVTVWNRLQFDNEADMQMILKTVKELGIDFAIDDSSGFIESETLYDTEERLDPSENGNQATIEIYQNKKLIWDNSIPETLSKT